MRDQRGAVQFILLLVLFVGLGAGFLLVNKYGTQFINKAAPNLPTKAESSFELELEKSGEAPFPDEQTPTSLAPNSKFRVDLYARSDVDETNLFAAKVKYSTDTVELVEVNTRDGQSFVKSWVEASSDNGIASLVGGVPAPGMKTDIKTGAFLMGSVIFKTKASGTVKIELSDASAIYRNFDNVNILSDRKGAIEVAIQNVQPTATPTPVVNEYKCSSVLVTGAMQSKTSGGETAYVIDSEGRVTLNAQINLPDGKAKWVVIDFKNLPNEGKFEIFSDQVAVWIAPRNSGNQIELVKIKADITNPGTPDKINNFASCPTINVAVKPVVPAPTAIPSPVPSSKPGVGAGSFTFSFTNTDVYPTKFTCKKGDTSCQLRVSFSATNKLDKPLYDAVFWTSNLATDKILVYRDFDGNEKSGKGTPKRTPVEPGAQGINGSSIVFTPPVNEDTSYATLYLDGQTCNLNVTPRDCVYYGASSIDVKKTTSGDTVTLEAINNSPVVSVGSSSLVCENYGDLNLDKKVTKEDTDIVSQILSGKINANSSGKEYMRIVGDVNDDEKIDKTDQDLIQQYLDGKTNSFPVCSNLKPLVCNHLGDVTGDGKLSKVDAQEVLNMVVGNPTSLYTGNPYTEEQKKNADVDREKNSAGESISAVDSLHILRYLKGETTVFKGCPGGVIAPSVADGNGDGNNDGKVDYVDLSILLTDFNKKEGFRAGVDVKGDGVINTIDFSLMKKILIGKKIN